MTAAEATATELAATSELTEASTAELAAMRTLIGAQDRKGHWTPPASLPLAEREKLDGALGQLLENLAPIAAIGEVRREF